MAAAGECPSVVMKRHYTVASKRGLIVRAGISLESEVVTTLPRGSTIVGDACSSREHAMSRLRIDQGWVSTRLLEPGPLVEDSEGLRALGLPPAPPGHPCPLHVANAFHERLEVATVAVG